MRERFLKEEGGFTLVEVLVAMMMMIFVMFALYSIFDMSIRVFSFGNDKIEAVENARIGLSKMEREIRAAYPEDKANDNETLFFSPTGANEITFGLDDVVVNRQVDHPSEEVTYRLNNGSGSCPSLPTAITDGVCTLQRVKNGVSSPMVEYVVPNGLSFEYQDKFGNPGAPDVADIVNIKLTVNKDGRTQELQTDVSLRNRED